MNGPDDLPGRIRALIDERVTLWLAADTLDDVVEIHEAMDALRCAFRFAKDDDLDGLKVSITWMRGERSRRRAPRPYMIKAADELSAAVEAWQERTT